METIRHAVALDFLRHLGEPVFCEDFNGFGYHMMVFSLADGVDGELALGRASAFDRIFGGPFGPVIDKAGLLTGDAFPFAATSTAEDAEFFRVVLL